MIRVRLITKYLYVTCTIEGLVRFEKDRTSENRLFCPCWGPCHRPNWPQPMGTLEAVKSTNESRARVVQNILKPLLHGMCRHRSPQSTNSWLGEGVFSKILGCNSGNIYGSVVQLRRFQQCVVDVSATHCWGRFFTTKPRIEIIVGVGGPMRCKCTEPTLYFCDPKVYSGLAYVTHPSKWWLIRYSIWKYLGLFCYLLNCKISFLTLFWPPLDIIRHRS